MACRALVLAAPGTRRRNRATNSIRDPTSTGGLVTHSTDTMFSYQAGAWSGFEAYSATSSRGQRSTAAATEACGERIPDARLSALPAARFCLADQERAEAVAAHDHHLRR